MSTDADACGGCFQPITAESTVVTGHRMAMSISTTQSVLWDQIQYAGNPAEFSWVLPVKQGARVEVAQDAFFDVLEAGTSTRVIEPPEGCASPPSVGCSSSDGDLAAMSGGGAGGGGVQVLHKGTVGPYETVTLSADDPGALNAWLEDNGYVVPDSIQPTIDAYVDEGFDFIALKLQPGQGVQAMKPVRVVTEGANLELPLRMVAAGAGAKVDLVLYVISEGRYETANFDNHVVPTELVTWDFRTASSDYAELRLKALEGNRWLTTYAQANAPLGRPFDARQFNIGTSSGSGFASGSPSSIAEAYFLQAADNGEALDENGNPISVSAAATCSPSSALLSSGRLVVDNCDAEGNCAELQPNEVPATAFACGNLDDIAVAITGMHPQDVFLTRLEASLPPSALNQDLQLQAAADQSNITASFQAALKVNHCWDNDQGRASGPVPWWQRASDGDPMGPAGTLMLTFAAAGMYLVARRRRREALES